MSAFYEAGRGVMRGGERLLSILCAEQPYTTGQRSKIDTSSGFTFYLKRRRGKCKSERTPASPSCEERQGGCEEGQGGCEEGQEETYRRRRWRAAQRLRRLLTISSNWSEALVVEPSPALSHAFCFCAHTRLRLSVCN